MPGLRPDVDPDGLLEYSVVYTDRALNHMSTRFQQVMRDVSATLKEVYGAARRSSCPAAAASAWRPSRASSPPASAAWSSATAGSATAGARSSRWAGSRRDPVVLKARRTRPRGAGALRAGAGRRGAWPRSASTRPAVVFAPHVETSAGMMLPDDYLRARGRRGARRRRAVRARLHRLAARPGSTWRATGVDVLVSAPQKGWSSPPCAGLVMLSRRGARAHRRHDQQQLLAAT